MITVEGPLIGLTKLPSNPRRARSTAFKGQVTTFRIQDGNTSDESDDDESDDENDDEKEEEKEEFTPQRVSQKHDGM